MFNKIFLSFCLFVYFLFFCLFQLCIVTLSLFDTLLSFNCEDIMLEILLKYLNPCQHIPILHRHKINKIDPYLNSVQYFLNLTPELMKYKKDISNISKTIGANWNHYGINNGETLYSNYHAYLLDARHKIIKCKTDCKQWNNLYRYQIKINSTNAKISSEKVIQMIRNFMTEFDQQTQQNQQAVINTKQQLDSLQSIGESSGYESFKYRADDEDDDNLFSSDENNSTSDNNKEAAKKIWKISNQKVETIADLDLSEDLFRQGTVSLGKIIFLFTTLLKAGYQANKQIGVP